MHSLTHNRMHRGAAGKAVVGVLGAGGIVCRHAAGISTCQPCVPLVHVMAPHVREGNGSSLHPNSLRFGCDRVLRA